MDRALDDIVSERQRGGRSRGRRGGWRSERNDYPRDGVKKAWPILTLAPFAPRFTRLIKGVTRFNNLLHPHALDSTTNLQFSAAFEHQGSLPCRRSRESVRDDNRNIDSEWVHDKYDDNTGRRPARAERRYSPEPLNESGSAKLRVENLHYDLTEDDLEDLFNRIGVVQRLSLTYDRAGRSDGVAYVTYETHADAKRAIREFDGANAKGQPIRLTLVPSGPAGGRRNPFDSATGPTRSLADRITYASGSRTRSLSPVSHSNTNRPPPPNVDRYVPGRGSRSRSPLPRRRDGRRPGVRKEGRERGAPSRGDRVAKDGRPKKTQEELDAEMEDYWGAKENGPGNSESAAAVTSAPAPAQEGDVEMAE